MQAGLADGQGHPFLGRDPTHFPTILAFLRDNQIPPLPEARPERQQLKAEAGCFALTELVGAIEAADAADEQLRQQVAAAERLECVHAASQHYLAAQRAGRLQAACRAVEEAEAAIRVGPFQEQWRLQEVAARLDSRLQALIQAREFDGVLEGPTAELARAVNDHQTHWDAHSVEMLGAEWARVRLRDAHLALLCALGADVGSAKAQLEATHPHLTGPDARTNYY